MLQVSAVLSPDFMICSFFFVFPLWLPHLASHSTLKHHTPLSLAQTCEVYFTGKCHPFQGNVVALDIL